MKETIARLVEAALASRPEIAAEVELASVSADVERARDPRHGDFATNVALRLAKSLGRNPRELAADIIAGLPESELVEEVSVAGPGFINFRLSRTALRREIGRVLAEGPCYGRGEKRDAPRVLVEFVSANPTGPLHVGHGRHASYGATVANLLEAAGYPVHREYYVNDAGRQMEILAVSVWLRYLGLHGETLPFPAAGYRGDYIVDIARELPAERFMAGAAEVLRDLPDDAPDGDKEARIDALIARAQTLLAEEGFEVVRRHALASILDDIRDDLAGFGVQFDTWFSEASLTHEGVIDEALEVLRERGMLYEREGAVWFRATDYGDEKDRVVVRDNGKRTYFASDIAYHYDKRQRGHDLLLDVLGADHHGYIARVRAGLESMGEPGDALEVRLVQFVALYRGGEKMQMSTRSGEFVTLRELREEVGNDAARLFYVMRSNDQHLDFDLELAKSRSNENPVYYIQYAHARVASVMRQLEEKGHAWDREHGLASLDLLGEEQEAALIATLTRFPEVIEAAAEKRAPQALVFYLRDLANEFHTYYNAHTFIVDDGGLRNARLTLVLAARQVIANGLGLLGVSAPHSM
ncbi:MAG TPA: arginine--tRNA ligase [Woeseiaceae bacterium]|nr:arginine--tRNA ligase [Woeseiaceae bacterium]